MYVSILIGNKYIVLSSAALLLLVPFYTWRKLYYSYENRKDEYEEEALFQKRHNCVVMYTANKGMSGWPSDIKRVKLDISREKCLDTLFEPILYFISTAEKSLEIAFTSIGLNSFYLALIEAQKRGVRVKVLLNFANCEDNMAEIQDLKKEGIQVLTYISQNQGMSCIMNYKFMVKDYAKRTGFVLTSSFSLVENAFLTNYEDVVFLSSPNVARAFHQNFKECWDYVKTDNEGLINNTILTNANLA